MKPKKVTEKLVLNKETVINLNEVELNSVKGGTSRTIQGCAPCFTYPYGFTECFNCED
jgi:hypothetical protein